MKFFNMLAFAVGPIVAAFLSLITLPFIAWFFSAEDVGRLSMVQIVLGLCVSLFSLQMHQAYVREYHEEARKGILFKASITPGLMLILFSILIVFLLPISISENLFNINSIYITLMLIFSILGVFFINFFSHTIRMQERGWAFSATQILPKFLIFLFVPIILFFDLSNDFYNLMLMNTLGVGISCGVLAWLTRDTWQASLHTATDKELQRKMLKFSAPLIAGGVAYWGLTGVDRFFLKNFSGLGDVGIYAMATSIASAAMVFSIVFSNVWHPTVYKWIKAGLDEDKVYAVMEGVLLFVAFVWSLFGLFSWIPVYFLPKEYISLTHIVVACVAAPLLYMLSETTAIGIGISRKTGYSMLASIIALVVNILLNFIFTPKFGVVSVSLVSAISFFIFFIIRTESSAFLWKSFPRAKLYLVCTIYMIFTFYFNMPHLFSINANEFLWLIPLSMTLFILRARVKFFIKIIKDKF